MGGSSVSSGVLIRCSDLLCGAIILRPPWPRSLVYPVPSCTAAALGPPAVRPPPRPEIHVPGWWPASRTGGFSKAKVEGENSMMTSEPWKGYLRSTVTSSSPMVTML